MAMVAVASVLAAAQPVATTTTLSRPRPLFSMSPTIAIDVTQNLTKTTPGDFSSHSQYLTRSSTATPSPDYYFKETYVLGGGAGTHMDSAAHLFGSSVIGGSAPSISEFDPSIFISPLVLIDVTSEVFTPSGVNGDYFVAVSDLINWECAHGPIPPGAFVAMKSGWSQYFGNEKQYRNTDPNNSNLYHFPGFGDLAVDFLLNNRSIHGIGVDTLSGDYGATSTYHAHYALLPAGKYIVENMQFSDSRIPAAGAMIATFPSLIKYAPETACRAIVYV